MAVTLDVLGNKLGLSLPLLSAAFLVAALLFASRFFRRDPRLPPSIPSHWLYGTHIPQPYSWRHFERWTKQYGWDVFTVWTGTRPLVVVNSYAAANELLEKQANITADRPRQVVGDEVYSRNKRILLVRHGERWRRLRRALHARLQIAVAKTYQDQQQRLAQNVLADILADPDRHQDHAQVYAASLVMGLTYGKTTKTTYEDADVKEVVRGFHRLGSLLRPGAYLANAFPFLKHIPGTLSTPRKWSEDEFRLFQRQFERVRQNMQSGKQPACYATFLLEHQKEYQLSDEECYYLCGSLFGAGSDTTASAVSILIMAAACYPEAQKKAQEELDRVVGRDRLPTFEDWPHLPYTWAYCREGFRWRPVSSGGFQHATAEDIVYKDYVIPKGTAIVGNHWAIHRDPVAYPDPEAFKPERWLRDDGEGGVRNTTDKELRLLGLVGADRSVFINAALLLHSFDISKKTDAQGNTIEIDTLAFSWQAKFTPREGSERLIKAAVA